MLRRYEETELRYVEFNSEKYGVDGVIKMKKMLLKIVGNGYFGQILNGCKR